MMRTTDNNLGNCRVEDAGELDFLQSISGLTLQTLAQDNKLFTIPTVFSHELQDDTPILLLDGNHRLHTGNVVGFIGNGLSTLEISSRFDSGKNNWLIHYMLCRTLGLNITSFSSFAKYESILDLLPFIFPHYLHKALSQGIYRPYTGIHRNDLTLKGRIDLVEHIKLNVPFVGRIAGLSRERRADNPVTQLIRHTIEHIMENPDLKSLFTSTKEIADDVGLVKSITPSFDKRALRKVVFENMRIKRHPYYTEYDALQQLCLMILNNRKMAYEGQKNKTNGLLIDAAWLWEEYLATVMKPLNICHPRNRSGVGAVYISNEKTYPASRHVNFQERYPDIYTKHGVIDAKYKHNVSRDDFHQIISYLHIMDKHYGVLLSPNDTSACTRDSYKLNGGGTLHIFKLGISESATTYAEFKESMQRNEQQLRDWIKTHETECEVQS